MIFQEIKTESGYQYTVEDVFGVMKIQAPRQLKGETLDSIVMTLLQKNRGPKIIQGSIKLKKGELSYEFIKEDQWSNDDEDTQEDEDEIEEIT